MRGVQHAVYHETNRRPLLLECVQTKGLSRARYRKTWGAEKPTLICNVVTGSRPTV
jgi:hypothetical protein